MSGICSLEIGCGRCGRGLCAGETRVIWWRREVAFTEAQGPEMCCVHRQILSPWENLSTALSQHKVLTLKPYNNVRHVHGFFTYPLLGWFVLWKGLGRISLPFYHPVKRSWKYLSLQGEWWMTLLNKFSPKSLGTWVTTLHGICLNIS